MSLALEEGLGTVCFRRGHWSAWGVQVRGCVREGLLSPCVVRGIVQFAISVPLLRSSCRKVAMTAPKREPRAGLVAACATQTRWRTLGRGPVTRGRDVVRFLAVNDRK